ncbi:MAG: hypothetical protein J6K00_06245 [Oscillospiraceae bacterium]|nr:hypothetical protein [Oscillospiraceae bacterium]
MNKQTAYVFAAFVLVLLIVAGVAAWAMGFFDSGEDRPDATEPPVESLDPALPSARPTETPLHTATPSPTPTAAPTPEPSSEPAGKVIASGAFDSNTGCGINTRTQWTASEKDGGTVLLTFKVCARSYSVGIGQRAYTITVNGASASGTTRAVDVDSPNAIVETLLFTYTAEISLPAGQSASVPVSVDWMYQGQYSGQDLDVIHSESVISLSR